MTGMNIGLIGLGAMGSGIASSIARNGINLCVYDRDEARLNAAINNPLIYERTAEFIIKESGLTLFCVPSAFQIDALLSKTSPKPGSIVVDLTTSDPRITKKRAERLFAQNKIYHMDAAMSGGAKGAVAGALTLMVGGDQHILDRCRHILSTFAAKIFYIGGPGKGQLMKLFHNAVCHGNFLLLTEICIKGEQHGLDLAQMIEVFNSSNARSYITEKRFPDHILSGTFDGQSTPANLKKDLSLLDEFLKVDGVDHSYLSHSLRILHMLDSKFENDDFMLIYPQLKQIMNEF